MLNEICDTCVSTKKFRLITEDEKPIKTENNLYYFTFGKTTYIIKKVLAPVPVWTNSKGNSVLQYGMVTLGGENGLNG